MVGTHALVNFARTREWLMPCVGDSSDIRHQSDEGFRGVRSRVPRLWRSRLVTTALLGLGLAVFSVGVSFRLLDLRIATVLSNSMQPTFSAGDVVLTRPVAVGALREGDVIAFVPPGSTRPLMHRITAIRGGVMTTRGDANGASDPWQLQLTGPTVERAVAVLPYVGWSTQFQRPLLLAAAVLACAAVLTAAGKEVGERLRRA